MASDYHEAFLKNKMLAFYFIWLLSGPRIWTYTYALLFSFCHLSAVAWDFLLPMFCASSCTKHLVASYLSWRRTALPDTTGFPLFLGLTKLSRLWLKELCTKFWCNSRWATYSNVAFGTQCCRGWLFQAWLHQSLFLLSVFQQGWNILGCGFATCFSWPCPCRSCF